MTRILPDTTQKRLRPQHRGTIVLLERTLSPSLPAKHRMHTDNGVPCLSDTIPGKRFAFVTGGQPYQDVSAMPGASAGSEAMCRQEHRLEARELSMTPKAQRRRDRRPRPFYVPQNGNQAGPLFSFEDRVTGYRLATCRGVIHHVMGEAEKFAKAQGLTLADIMVRIVE